MVVASESIEASQFDRVYPAQPALTGNHLAEAPLEVQPMPREAIQSTKRARPGLRPFAKSRSTAWRPLPEKVREQLGTVPWTLPELKWGRFSANALPAQTPA